MLLREKVCASVGANQMRELVMLEKYASQGCRIAFMDVNKEFGMQLKQKLEDTYGVSVFFFHGDMKSEEDMDLFMGAIEGMYGGVDYLICRN